jgi:hypothetical protein
MTNPLCVIGKNSTYVEVCRRMWRMLTHSDVSWRMWTTYTSVGRIQTLDGWTQASKETSCFFFFMGSKFCGTRGPCDFRRWTDETWNCKKKPTSVMWGHRVDWVPRKRDGPVPLVLNLHIGHDPSGVQLAQSTSEQFHYRRATFSSQLKSKIDNILSKSTALRIVLNIDDAPVSSKSHTHPSHSSTSRLLTSSLSLGVPVPRTTQWIRVV